MDLQINKINGWWRILGGSYKEIPKEVRYRSVTLQLETSVQGEDGTTARVVYSVKSK